MIETLKQYVSSAEVWMTVEAGLFALALALLRAEGRVAALLASWSAFAARPRAPYAAVVGTTLVLCVLSALLYPPAPRFHDEFSYLLQADTFVHGRLANPPHPFWEHFESFHVLSQPTYASKYPAGQGLALAPGQAIGMPWLSAWGLAAAGFAALLWMLRGWLPPPLAFAGAMLAVLHPRMFLAWSTSYWGGALALLGGSLVYGAVPRRHPLPLALGAVVLGLARPYEGLLAVAPAVLFLALRGDRRRFVTRTVPTLAVFGAALIAFTLHYNRRITDHPLRMPYQLHHEQYDVAGLFVFQPPRPRPRYNHEIIERLNVADGETQRAERTPALWAVKCLYKIWYQTRFHLGFLLLLPFALGVRAAWRDARLPVVAVALGVVGNFLGNFQQPHYLAPVSAAIFYLVARGLPPLARRPRVVVAGLAVVLAWPLVALAWQAAKGPDTFEQERRALVRRLEATEGRHLVLVAPDPTQDVHKDWVWNGADLVGAKVLFARDMGPARNARLLAHHPDRRVWRLAPGAPPGAKLTGPETP